MGETNLEIVMELYGILNLGELDRLSEVLAPGFKYHAGGPHDPDGALGLRWLWTALRSELPEISFALNEFMADGNRIIIRGELTRRRFPVGRFLAIAEITDGRITDLWSIHNLGRGWRLPEP